MPDDAYPSAPPDPEQAASEPCSLLTRRAFMKSTVAATAIGLPPGASAAEAMDKTTAPSSTVTSLCDPLRLVSTDGNTRWQSIRALLCLTHYANTSASPEQRKAAIAVNAERARFWSTDDE